MSAASLFVSKCVSLSEYNWAVTHATRSAEGNQGCREDAHDDLDNGLPSFFLHSALFLMVNVTDSIILARIPRIYTAFLLFSRVSQREPKVEPAGLGSGAKVHLSKRAEMGTAGLGSGTKVQSLATLLWGLTPVCTRLRLVSRTVARVVVGRAVACIRIGVASRAASVAARLTA